MTNSTEPTPYSVKAVLILPGGIILLRHPLKSINGMQRSERGIIKALSRRSLFRLALVAQSSTQSFYSMLTLTYGPNYPQNGKTVKNHIKRVIQWLNKRLCEKYLWFVEFQARGAPHIHILTDLCDLQVDCYRNEMAVFWAGLAEPEGWAYSSLHTNRHTNRLERAKASYSTTRGAVEVVHRHPMQWQVLRSREGAARYVTKYASKIEQKQVPENYINMGRFWGAPQSLSLKNLIKTWVYTDDEGAMRMSEMMGRDFSSWESLPKIIVGNTDAICKIISHQL